MFSRLRWHKFLIEVLKYNWSDILKNKYSICSMILRLILRVDYWNILKSKWAMLLIYIKNNFFVLQIVKCNILKYTVWISIYSSRYWEQCAHFRMRSNIFKCYILEIELILIHHRKISQDWLLWVKQEILDIHVSNI